MFGLPSVSSFQVIIYASSSQRNVFICLRVQKCFPPKVSLFLSCFLSLRQPEQLVSFTHPSLFSFNCVALILCLCHMSYGNTHRFVCFWLSFELKFLFCCGSPCFAQNEPHLTSIRSLSTNPPKNCKQTNSSITYFWYRQNLKHDIPQWI